MSDTITQTSLPGAETNVDAAGGEGAGSTPVELKDLLNQELGKQFPTNEAAIKSIKDTYAYVGQAGQKVKTLEEQIAQQAQNQPVNETFAKDLESLRQEVKQSTFYAQHPELNNPEVKALITDMGGDPEVVIQKDSFKTAFNAMKTAAEIEQSKSVLHSNPRLGIVQDKMTKAKESLQGPTPNWEVAAQNATASVLEAYESKS